MTPTLESLRRSPNALAPYYSAFRVGDRLLLTGHSHQAWPDASFEGQKQAWLDAAEHADGKWDAVAEKVERVSQGYRSLMGGCNGDITLETNTHGLVVRFLSALPLRDRPRIVTTDGEFHSIRRQLDRLAEEGLDVVKLSADPVTSLAERGVRTDYRGTVLCFGPAPYLSDRQIVDAMEMLGNVVRGASHRKSSDQFVTEQRARVRSSNGPFSS